MAATDITRSPLPSRDALDPHTGRWVAIRDGMVVASADDLEALTAMSPVRETDLLYAVPARATYFYRLA